MIWTAAIALVTLLALVTPWGETAAQPRALPPDHPLEQHRRGIAASQAPIRGRVVAVDEGMLLTDLTLAALARGGIQDGDQVRLRLAGRTLAARLLGAESYRELMLDAAWAETLDVDVVAVAEEGGVVLVGLGAPLADWIGARAGAIVLVEGR